MTDLIIRDRRHSTEVRDPSAATRSLSWTSPGYPMVPEWNADTALRWGFYANVFVYACLTAIAEDLAALPFRVGPNPDRPQDFDPGHPLARLLGPPPGGPNRATDPETFWAWSVIQHLATGRVGWEIEPAGPRDSRPVALWPLPATHLKAIPTTSGSSWFAGFRFGKLGEERDLGVDRVFYHWRPSQTDWRQPESALQAARLDISVAVMQDRYDYAFLRNDARPALVVVHEAFASVEETRAFRNQFLASHQGVDNAGKTAFMEYEGGAGSAAGLVDVKTLGLSSRDAQFLERYDAKIRGICAGLGVPMSRLMDSSKRTFSNADSETVNYWRSTVLPLARRFASAVNMQLAPRLGAEVGWFDTSGVAALAEPSRVATIGPQLVPLVSAGIITADEARAELDLGPRPMVPEPAAQVEPPSDPPADPPQRQRRPPEPEHRVWSDEQLDVRRAKVYAAVDAKARAMERTWRRQMAALFDRQGRAVVANLQSKRGRRAVAEVRADAPGPDQIFDRTFWTNETRDVAEGLFEMVVAAGAGRVADLLGVSFDLLDAWAQEMIQARANQLAGMVVDTTYQAVKDAMTAGVSEGESIPKLAARIRAVFADASERRATTIARTEVISAFNGSAAAFAAVLGPDVVSAQEWVATRDGRTRLHHAEADGQVAIIGSPFSVGGAELAYPGDPSGPAGEVVNCRCTLLLLTPDEMVDRGLIPAVPLPAARAILAAVVDAPPERVAERVRAAARRAALHAA